jgi:hypothetical protein
MKPLDDKKIIEQNAILEKELENERKEWKDKVIELVNMMKDNKKLSESQVFQLSYRQQVQEKLAAYRILIEKRQGMLETQSTARFRDYTLNYDIKLSSSEKSSFVSADLNALKQQINMIKTQITYFEECVKTLDNFGFAVRNKLEILSQQLV